MARWTHDRGGERDWNFFFKLLIWHFLCHRGPNLTQHFIQNLRISFIMGKYIFAVYRVQPLNFCQQPSVLVLKDSRTPGVNWKPRKPFETSVTRGLCPPMLHGYATEVIWGDIIHKPWSADATACVMKQQQLARSSDSRVASSRAAIVGNTVTNYYWSVS